MTPPLPARLTAPDLIEPVVGFRQWRLIDGALASVFTATVWRTPGLDAHCDSGDHDPAVVPSHDCTCGVYAYHALCPRTASLGSAQLVSGAVILWGRLEVHAVGMRGEHARIVGLALPPRCSAKRRALAAAAVALGVPAVLHRGLRTLALEHGRPLDRCLIPPRVRPEIPGMWSGLRLSISH